MSTTSNKGVRLFNGMYMYNIHVHVYICTCTLLTINILFTTLQRSRHLTPVPPRTPHSSQPIIEPRPPFSQTATGDCELETGTGCITTPSSTNNQIQSASDQQEPSSACATAEATTINNLQDPPASSTPNTVSSTPTCTGLPSSARLSELRRSTCSCSKRNFAKKIAVEMYTRDELYTSNVNGKLGKKQLDPVRLAMIIETVFLAYPLEHQEKMEKALRDCRHAIDEYGRELHRQEKDKKP